MLLFLEKVKEKGTREIVKSYYGVGFFFFFNQHRFVDVVKERRNGLKLSPKVDGQSHLL